MVALGKVETQLAGATLTGQLRAILTCFSNTSPTIPPIPAIPPTNPERSPVIILIPFLVTQGTVLLISALNVKWRENRVPPAKQDRTVCLRWLATDRMRKGSLCGDCENVECIPSSTLQEIGTLLNPCDELGENDPVTSFPTPFAYMNSLSNQLQSIIKMNAYISNIEDTDTSPV